MLWLQTYEFTNRTFLIVEIVHSLMPLMFNVIWRLFSLHTSLKVMLLSTFDYPIIVRHYPVTETTSSLAVLRKTRDQEGRPITMKPGL